ncbi:MAG: hypothetical protein PSX81_11860 [bacterium]|nr:hypothetical protein [bacterium]
MLAFWVLMPLMDMPAVWDSGCFMYIGQNWLNGLVPYSDMWDHKGPMLYILNLLGLLIDGRNGVVYLQFFLSAMAFYLSFIVFRIYVQALIALAYSAIGFFYLLFLHQTGNQTEQWALFFQAFSLFVFVNIYSKPEAKSYASWLLMGVLMACVLLIRPNQIAIWVVIVIFELVITWFNKKPFSQLFLRGLFMLFGLIIPIFVVVIYFAKNNALNQMIECFFKFNFIYAGGNHTSILDNIKFSLVTLPFLWVMIVCIVFNYGLFIYKRNEIKKVDWALLLFTSTWLALEVFLSSLAGAYFLHYYIQWILPIMASMIVFMRSLKYLNLSPSKYFYTIYIFTGMLFLFIGAKTVIRHRWQMYGRYLCLHNERSFYKTAEFINQNTTSKDYLLEWGIVDGLNFETRLKSPSKYFYQYPLDTKGYTNDSIVHTFINDVKSKEPKFIIDASKFERLPYLNQHARDSFYEAKPYYKGLLPKSIDSFYAYVDSNYIKTKTIGIYIIYQRKVKP